MFNLDQAISEWRRQMAVGGLKMPDVLNELESHLREDLEGQVRSGLNEQEAFNAAVQRIGQSKALKKEFRKVNRHRDRGFHDNPLVVNILAIWLMVMGISALRMSLSVLQGPGYPPFSLIVLVLSAILSMIFAIGLARRKNIFRICAMVWFGLHILRNLYYVALSGLSHSVFVYAPLHPSVPGQIRYSVFWFFTVPYPAFYAVGLLSMFMLFFGLFVLSKLSIRNCFQPVSN
jgi:hypothetical protein